MDIAKTLFVELSLAALIELPEKDFRDAALTIIADKAIDAEQTYYDMKALTDEERKTKVTKARKKLATAVRASTEDSGLSFDHRARPDHF